MGIFNENSFCGSLKKYFLHIDTGSFWEIAFVEQVIFSNGENKNNRMKKLKKRLNDKK